MTPLDPQKCAYCDQPAEKSLIYSEGRESVAICAQHDNYARRSIAANGGAICDSQVVMGVRENVSFGLQATGARAVSAMTEAPSRAAATPPATPKQASSMLKALGTNWRQIRMRRVHDHRISVDMDGAKFTLYTRNG